PLRSLRRGASGERRFAGAAGPDLSSRPAHRSRHGGENHQQRVIELSGERGGWRDKFESEGAGWSSGAGTRSIVREWDEWAHRDRRRSGVPDLGPFPITGDTVLNGKPARGPPAMKSFAGSSVAKSNWPKFSYLMESDEFLLDTPIRRAE